MDLNRALRENLKQAAFRYPKVSASVIDPFCDRLFRDERLFKRIAAMWECMRSVSVEECWYFAEKEAAILAILSRDVAELGLSRDEFCVAATCADVIGVYWKFEIEPLLSLPYSEYLLTDQWKAIRLSKIEQVGGRCQLCNAAGTVDVHHRHYEWLRGLEDLKDLTVLCRPCHVKFHGKAA